MNPFPCNHLNQNWYDFFTSTLPNEHILDLNKTCFSCTKSLKSVCMITQKMKFKTINIFSFKISKKTFT